MYHLVAGVTASFRTLITSAVLRCYSHETYPGKKIEKEPLIEGELVLLDQCPDVVSELISGPEMSCFVVSFHKTELISGDILLSWKHCM